MTQWKVSPQHYEMHITLDPQYKYIAEDIATKYKFKTSQIAGDQVLGDDVFLYLTGKDVSLFEMSDRMYRACDELEGNKIPIVRRKIEHILLDERAQ